VTGAGIFDGARPRAARDLRDPETAGIAPVPESARYGRPSRVFFPWWSGNMELSAVFLGTVAAQLGLGFPLGAAAIVAGIVLGAVPVAYLGTWGPLTGTAQLPLARVPFGRSVVVPAFIQWASAVAWMGIACYFGAQAVQVLTGLPFLASAALVLAVVTVIAAWGYEGVMQVELAGSAVMAILFALLTVRLLARHLPLPRDSAHGGALAGAAVVMVAIALSGSGSWASYGSDYSRYLPAATSRARVFWWGLAGQCGSYCWLAVLGLAASSALGDQTATGVRSLLGGAAGDAAMAAIAAAAVVSSSVNAYSSSLALQALGARIRRPVIAVASSAAALALIWWMQSGDVSQRVTNVLVFTGYWLAPFFAVVLLDWRRRRASYEPGPLAQALDRRAPRPGWPALAAFAAGFGAMIPFMDTTLVVGPAARALDGADLSYYVGFAVAAAAYAVLSGQPRQRTRRRDRAVSTAARKSAGLGVDGSGGPVRAPGR
jgi:nucleobase:cation symporter-1, NCS1 family